MHWPEGNNIVFLMCFSVHLFCPYKCKFCVEDFKESQSRYQGTQHIGDVLRTA